MNELTFICVHIVSQLSAHNSGSIVIIAIMTHCSPHSIDADLHPANTLHWSINQTKCSISAILGNYVESKVGNFQVGHAQT